MKEELEYFPNKDILLAFHVEMQAHGLTDYKLNTLLAEDDPISTGLLTEEYEEKNKMRKIFKNKDHNFFGSVKTNKPEYIAHVVYLTEEWRKILPPSELGAVEVGRE